jgi:uncharacterized membrane protein YraQ (UPF0718 family)
VTKKRPLFDWALMLVAVLSVSAATFIFWRDGWHIFRDILLEDAQLFVGILPKVAAGCLIGALVRLLIPQDMVARWVGEGSGLRGLLVATLAGALFPGGPFTIFPLAVSFMMIGADKGTAVAFVTSWLLIGLTRVIIWEMPFFGTDFVLLRVLMSLPFPIIAGFLARLLDRAITARYAMRV